jgi:hypothetical protein
MPLIQTKAKGGTPVELTDSEMELILEALESHAYWQVSDESFRNNGYVYAPGSENEEAREELRRIDALAVRLGGEPITGEKL